MCKLQLQSNLDYPDLLGLDEIVWIGKDPDNKNMNINEEKCSNKVTFNGEITPLQIVVLLFFSVYSPSTTKGMLLITCIIYSYS